MNGGREDGLNGGMGVSTIIPLLSRPLIKWTTTCTFQKSPFSCSCFVVVVVVDAAAVAVLVLPSNSL